MDLYLEVFNKQVSEKQRKLIEEPVNEDLIEKNKFANGAEFVPDSVYKRLLNKISNYQWSFVPHSVETISHDEGFSYIRYIGLLIVPGLGVHTGIGTVPLTKKKDNSKATASAKTYAFKNACKEMGLAPNIGDEKYDEELFEFDIEEEKEFDMTEQETPEPKKKKKTESKTDTKKSSGKDKKDKPKKKEATKEERIEEIREAYEVEDDDDFVAFIQIWDEDILDLEDMDDDDWENFFDYLEKNKKKFEDF